MKNIKTFPNIDYNLISTIKNNNINVLKVYTQSSINKLDLKVAFLDLYGINRLTINNHIMKKVNKNQKINWISYNN